MIAVKLEGRLGNQLFQYAFIYAAAKKLNTKFYLDKSIDYLVLDKYFKIDNDFCYFFDRNIFSIKGYKNIFSHHLRYKYYKLLHWFLGLKSVTFDNDTEPSEQVEIIANNHIYRGFFQSEEYFKDYKSEIKFQFSIRDCFAVQFKKKLNQLGLSGKYVAVHIRRGDYSDMDISLPVSYYKEALSLVMHEDTSYVFVSDDTAYVEREFAFLENKYISDNSEIMDLQFLINAEVCILSSSSFSWWGAWLNSNTSKRIFAPKYWLGFKEEKEFPTGIAEHLNINWIQI